MAASFSAYRGCSTECGELVKIEGVRSDSILTNWGSIEPHLQRVLDKIDSGHTVEDVLTKLQWQDQQLWNVNDWQAIAVTQISILPQHKVLSVVYVSGDDVDEWLPDLVSTLREFAQSTGCKYVEFYGRDGWRKKAKPLGFDNAFSVMRLDVNGQQGR